MVPIKSEAAESQPKLYKDELYVAFFNLPDGEATLINVKDGPNILINTGSKQSEESLLSQLKELNISMIDTLILTKQTNDYCGNTKRIVDRFKIEEIVHAGDINETCMGDLPQEQFNQWKTSDLNEVSDQLFFKVLKAEIDGEMSLAITYGETSVMYLSTSDVKDEEEILNYPLEPEILKIADYGTGQSPSSSFLTEIDPHLSVVFNCENCIPNEGLIERLNESWIDVYHLERVGTTIIRMNLDTYEVVS